MIDRGRAGDGAAVDALFARYLRPLQRWASGRLPVAARDLTDTADVVQETLLRTLGRLGAFEARGTGAFFAYLRQGVINRIRDEARRVSRRPPGSPDEGESRDPGPSPVELAIGRERLERFERALARLEPLDQEAVLARVELGLSYPEIARSLGKSSADAARMAVTRALARLAAEMAREQRA